MRTTVIRTEYAGLPCAARQIVHEIGVDASPITNVPALNSCLFWYIVGRSRFSPRRAVITRTEQLVATLKNNRVVAAVVVTAAIAAGILLWPG